MADTNFTFFGENNFTCTILNFTELDDYAVPEWANTKRIEKNHERAVRFGNTNDINDLINGSKEDQHSYVMGLLAGAIFVFAIFIIWTFLLILFKCCGPKRVGFLSGSRIYTPRPPEEEEEESEDEPGDDIKEDEGGEGFENVVSKKYGVSDEGNDHLVGTSNKSQTFEKWEEEVLRIERKIMWIRIAVLLSGAAIIACVILFMVKGVDGLQKTIDSANLGIERIDNLVHKAIDLIDGFQEGQTQVNNQTNSFLGSDECTVEDIFPALEENIDEVRDFVNETSQFIVDQVSGLREDLYDILDLTADIQKATNNFDWAFWVAGGFGCALAVLCLFVMASVVLAWRRRLYAPIACLRTYFIMPLFLFLVFMGMLFSVIFMIGATAASDTCVDNPDTKLVEWIRNLEFNSIVTKLAVYYVSGCPLEEGVDPRIFEEEIDDAINIFGTISVIFTQITNVLRETLEGECGANAADAIEDAGELTEAQVCVIAVALAKIRVLFYCSNWRPIYDAFMWDAICYNGVDGMTWVFSTQIAIVILAMIIVTLRVGFYPIEEEPVEALSCCRRWFCCCLNKDQEEIYGDGIVGEQDVVGQNETVVAEAQEINTKDVVPDVHETNSQEEEASNK